MQIQRSVEQLRKVLEMVTWIGFFSFVIGAFAMVLIQISGLLLMQPAVVGWGRETFDWIIPVSSLVGLACFVLPYLTKKSE